MAAEDAGSSLEAAVAMKNFSFHMERERMRVIHNAKTPLPMTSVVIDGVTKAVVEDFAI